VLSVGRSPNESPLFTRLLVFCMCVSIQSKPGLTVYHVIRLVSMTLSPSSRRDTHHIVNLPRSVTGAGMDEQNGWKGCCTPTPPFRDVTVSVSSTYSGNLSRG